MLSICICFFATHYNFSIHHVTMNGLIRPFPKTWSTYIIYSRDAKHSHRSNISHQWPTTAGGSSSDIKLLLDVFVVEPFVGTRPTYVYIRTSRSLLCGCCRDIHYSKHAVETYSRK